MRTRIMSGAVLIVILFTCLYFGGWVTFGFSLFISLVGMYELIKVKKLEKTGLAVVGYIAAITYYFILLLNDPAYILLLLVASCILMMSVYVFTFPKYKTEDVNTFLYLSGKNAAGRNIYRMAYIRVFMGQ